MAGQEHPSGGDSGRITNERTGSSKAEGGSFSATGPVVGSSVTFNKGPSNRAIALAVFFVFLCLALVATLVVVVVRISSANPGNPSPPEKRQAVLEPINTPGQNPFVSNLPANDAKDIRPAFPSGGEFPAWKEQVFGGVQGRSPCEPQDIWGKLSASVTTRDAWLATLAGRIEKAEAGGQVGSAPGSPGRQQSAAPSARSPRPTTSRSSRTTIPSPRTSFDAATVARFIASLTPVVLRGDTLVENHGFRGGKSTPYLSVLQIGTVVLIDAFGAPVTKCASGNPLLPAPTDYALEYSGNKWPGFDPGRVVTPREASKPLPAFTLVEVGTNRVFTRPAGSRGDLNVNPSASPSADPTPTPDPPSPTAEPEVEATFGFSLSSPKQGANVQQAQQVSGTVTGLSPSESLWMFVVPVDGQPAKYHPQVASVDLGRHEWSGTAYFGTENHGTNLDYTLIITRLTAEGSATTEAYLAQYRGKADYPGMSQIPAGSQVLQSIGVHRP